MSEHVEVYRAMRDERQRENAERLSRITERVKALEAAGKVAVRQFNGGLHLRVRANGKEVDLWPSTERWRVTGRSKVNQGFATALTYLGVKESGGG